MNNQTEKTSVPLSEMTLRDFFAAQAMQADLTGYEGSYWERVAKQAYEMADAMMEARK